MVCWNQKLPGQTVWRFLDTFDCACPTKYCPVRHITSSFVCVTRCFRCRRRRRTNTRRWTGRPVLASGLALSAWPPYHTLLIFVCLCCICVIAVCWCVRASFALSHFVLVFVLRVFFVVRQAYGFHAPIHQDHQRYSSIALRGGEDSIMEPDLLAVRTRAFFTNWKPGLFSFFRCGDRVDQDDRTF